MNTAKGPQKVTQTGPDAFHGVAMNFPDAIAIIIPSPFFLRGCLKITDSLVTIKALQHYANGGNIDVAFTGLG